MGKSSAPRPPASKPARSRRTSRTRRRKGIRAFTPAFQKAWKRLHPETRRALSIVGAVFGLAAIIGLLWVFNSWGVISLGGTPEAESEIWSFEPHIPDEPLTVWTKAAVYLRDEPDPEAARSTLIPVSSELYQLEQRGSWSLVEYEEVQGYIALQHLTILQPLRQAADVLDDAEPGKPLTRAQQTELLAHLIYSESGSQTRLAQVYTGSVVLNRAGGDPEQFERVIFRPGAFDVVPNRSILKEPSVLSRSVASDLMTYGSRLPAHVLYFHRYDTDNAWTRQLAVYVQEDEVVFAYWPGEDTEGTDVGEPEPVPVN